MDAFRKAYVYVRNIYAGVLSETDEGYSFSYVSEYLLREDAGAVSLTLPLAEQTYTSKTLFLAPTPHLPALFQHRRIYMSG